MKKSLKSETESNTSLDRVETQKLSDTQKELCEKEIRVLFIQRYEKYGNKSPDNDGLTKEFCETFWDEIFDLFYKSVKDVKTKKKLSVSQKQTVIKLIEKRIEINDI